MAEQSKRHLRRVLHECAESGMPDITDPWPAIRERIGRQGTNEVRASAEQAGEAGRAPVGPRRRQLVPSHPLGWVLAVLSVLIVGVGVYAASGPFREVFRDGLPGTVGVGSEKDAGGNLGTQGGDGLSALKTEIGQTKTQDGVRLTLDWAYADERFVAVGLHTQRLDDTQGAAQSDSTVLEPALWDDSVGDESKLPPYVKITDASGQDFDTVGGGTRGGRANVVFDAPEGLKVGKEHRLRLEVPLDTAAGGTPGEKPAAGPFIFDFEVPVRPAPTIEVNQDAEAKGITLTLKQVIDSPANPQAIVCGVPGDGQRWTPWLEDQGGGHDELVSAPQKLENGCWSLSMGHPVEEGSSSLTVARLEGVPIVPPDRAHTPGKPFSVKPKTIRGPWTFKFDTHRP